MHPRWPRTALEGVSPPTRPPNYPQNECSVIARSHHEGGPLTTSPNRSPGAHGRGPRLAAPAPNRAAVRLTPPKWRTPPGRGPGALESSELVPHIGFEPMISALRGLCPRPLDECGIEAATLRPAGRDNIRPRPGVPIRVLGPEPDQSLCDSRKARTPSATCW